MAKIYYDGDADLGLLKGKKIAIVGYGSQGHAQAQNLRDSGLEVIVAELEGTENYELARSHGFSPVSAEEAALEADYIQLLVPDNLQPRVRNLHQAPPPGGEGPRFLPWLQHPLQPDRTPCLRGRGDGGS